MIVVKNLSDFKMGILPNFGKHVLGHLNKVILTRPYTQHRSLLIISLTSITMFVHAHTSSLFYYALHVHGIL